MSKWRLGIDIGGTFTDVIALNTSLGEIRSAKVPTCKADPVEGLMAGIRAVDLNWNDVKELTHGTTMVTNDIVEGLNEEVILITTKGFADTLAIGRVRRRHIYHMDLPPKLPPLVPQHFRLEVDERMDRNGVVVTELTQVEIDRVIEQVRAIGIQAVAICLIHGYRNPAHEKMLGEALHGKVDHVCMSHVVSPEIREYERTNTTVLSASVANRVRSYLKRIDAHKPRSTHLHFFHSSGGMAAPKVIEQHPLLLAKSGPAAGVGATVSTLAALGIDKALTLDMGGTTTDTCLIVDGKAEISSDRELGDRRIRLPMMAVHSIGAGGGSIARMDTGALVVGPRSAGSFPGPACYGLGGTEPTISDANVVLGYLSPERTLGKTIKIDHKAALAVIEPIAKATDRTVEDVAIGILAVAHSNMVRALNQVTVERGVDGRECTLIAFGGGGPMHAAFVARHYGIQKVLCPAFSSGYSALGCVAAKMSYTQQRTINVRSQDWDTNHIEAIRKELTTLVAAPMKESGHDTDKCDLEFVAMMRYRGQSYDVPVPNAELNNIAKLEKQFFARHEELFGFSTNEPWELGAIRVTMTETTNTTIDAIPTTTEDDPVASSRECFFNQTGWADTPVYNRIALRVSGEIKGPAVIEDEWSTIIVPPLDSFRVDELGHIHITIGAEE